MFSDENRKGEKLAVADKERVVRRPIDEAADIWRKLAAKANEGQPVCLVISDKVVAALTTKLSIVTLGVLAEQMKAVQIIPRLEDENLQVIVQVSETQPLALWEGLIESLRSGRSDHSITKTRYERVFRMVQGGYAGHWDEFGRGLVEMIEELPRGERQEEPSPELILFSNIAAEFEKSGDVSLETLEELQVLGFMYFDQLGLGTQNKLIGQVQAPYDMWNRPDDYPL